MKVCPNCGNSVDEGARFCNVCGTTIPVATEGTAPVLTASPVTCGVCGAVNPVGASACSVCGAMLTVEPAPVGAPEEPKKDVRESAKEIGDKVAKSAKEIGGKAVAAAKTLGGKIKEAKLDEKIKKVPKKIWMIAGGVVAALLLLIILVNVFDSGMDYNFALFVNDDGQLSYTKLTGRGDPVEITEEGYTGYWAMADDSKTLFYVSYNDDGEMCLYYRNATKAKKDPVELDSDVDGNFAINEDGSKVYYMKNGNLYVHNLKKSEKIESHVEYFVLSENGKKVLYGNDDGELYIWNGKKSTEIDSDVEDLYYCSEDLKVIYYQKNGDLYLKSGSKKSQKVLSDCGGISINETGKGYASTNDGELYYIDGKKATKIAKDVSSVRQAYERSVVVYSVDDGDEWYVAVKGKAYELDVDDVYNVRLSNNGKLLYLLLDPEDGHGDLVRIKIGSKPGEAKVMDEEVYYSSMGFNENNKFYYFKDMDGSHGTLYFDGKEIAEDVYYSSYGFMGNKPYYLTDVKSGEGTLCVKGKEVAEDVAVDSIRYNEEKKSLVFMSDWDEGKSEGTLNFYKSKTKVIAEDVYYTGSHGSSRDFFIMPEGQILYFVDYDFDKGEGTLNCFNGSKSVELSDSARRYVAIYNYED